MWAVWITVGAAAATALAVFISLFPTFRARPLGWKMLSASGLPLAIAGIIFVVRFWEPTPGPYRANALYPYGDHLHAWAVSFGFTWLAFGLLFSGMALLRGDNRMAWLTLLASWLLCWLPHGVIGVAFAWAGGNAPSIQAYRNWASDAAGRILLISDALMLVAHFGLSISGFVLTGIEWRREQIKNLSVHIGTKPSA